MISNGLINDSSIAVDLASLLPSNNSLRGGGHICAWAGGVSAPGGGVTALGGSAPGGVCSRGGLLWGG